MSPADLQATLREQPFEPFRIHVSDGTSFDVRHPDLCMVFPRVVHVAVPADSQWPERVVKVDPLHITRLEPIPTQIRPA